MKAKKIKAGDIWETPDGQQWHAQYGSQGILLRPVWTAERFMKLNPKLVKRIGR